MLITAGVVNRHDLYEVLGDLTGAPYIDLTAEPPDPELLAGLDPPQLVRQGWVPGRVLPDGRVLVVGVRRPRAKLHDSIERALGRPAVYAVTTDWDILSALQHGLRQVILDQAALGPWQRSAGQSARVALYPRQRIEPARRPAVVIAWCSRSWRWR